MANSKVIDFQDININVPWGRIAGRWYGNFKVRPILALHGWQDNLGTWDRLIPLLPRHISILCIDLPGHGKSSKYPAGAIYHVGDYVKVIIRIVKEYRWHKVSLMGHSMGAVVAFFYTALYPHMVDVLIQFDLIKTVHYPLDKRIQRYRTCAERSLIENERLQALSLTEPPSHSYQQLEDILYHGSKNSVSRENCKFLLNRSIERSQLYPNKYYFSRDRRIQYIVQFSDEIGLSIELAKRIKGIAYILIKSDTSDHMAADDDLVINILKSNNPHFQLHVISDSTHHLHLNNAEEVAAIINSFLLKHRPLNRETLGVDHKEKSKL